MRLLVYIVVDGGHKSLLGLLLLAATVAPHIPVLGGRLDRNSHACSSRSGGECKPCDGTIDCYDLSDEMYCKQETVKADFTNQFPSCNGVLDGLKCGHTFMEPPPLPPFPLCDTFTTSTVAPSIANTSTSAPPSQRTSSIPIAPSTESPVFAATTILSWNPVIPITPTDTPPTSGTTGYWAPWTTATSPTVTTRGPVRPPTTTIGWNNRPAVTLPPTRPFSYFEIVVFCMRYNVNPGDVLMCIARILNCYKTACYNHFNKAPTYDQHGQNNRHNFNNQIPRYHKRRSFENTQVAPPQVTFFPQPSGTVPYGLSDNDLFYMMIEQNM